MSSGIGDQHREALRAHLLRVITAMGQIVVPEHLYDEARELLPEVADKIIKSERLPTTYSGSGNV